MILDEIVKALTYFKVNYNENYNFVHFILNLGLIFLKTLEYFIIIYYE